MQPKKVLYKQYIHAKPGGANGRPLPGTGCWEDGYSMEGLFHQFGVSYVGTDSGPANFSTAIIETPNGEVIMVNAEHIKFVR